jgi:hypothetical protein
VIGGAVVSVEQHHGTPTLVLRIEVGGETAAAEMAARVRCGDLEPVRVALARAAAANPAASRRAATP